MQQAGGSGYGYYQEQTPQFGRQTSAFPQYAQSQQSDMYQNSQDYYYDQNQQYYGDPRYQQVQKIQSANSGWEEQQNKYQDQHLIYSNQTGYGGQQAFNQQGSNTNNMQHEMYYDGYGGQYGDELDYNQGYTQSQQAGQYIQQRNTQNNPQQRAQQVPNSPQNINYQSQYQGNAQIGQTSDQYGNQQRQGYGNQQMVNQANTHQTAQAGSQQANQSLQGNQQYQQNQNFRTNQQGNTMQQTTNSGGQQNMQNAQGRSNQQSQGYGQNTQSQQSITQSSDNMQYTSQQAGYMQNAPQQAGNIQNTPQQAGNIQNTPQQTGNIQNMPQQAVNIQNTPQQAVNIQNTPQQAGNIQNRPQQAGNMQSVPQQAGNIQNAHQQVGNFQNAPQQAGNIQNTPQQAGNIQNTPQQPGNMQNTPQQPGNMQNRPQQSGNIQNAPQQSGNMPQQPYNSQQNALNTPQNAPQYSGSMQNQQSQNSQPINQAQQPVNSYQSNQSIQGQQSQYNPTNARNNPPTTQNQSSLPNPNQLQGQQSPQSNVQTQQSNIGRQNHPTNQTNQQRTQQDFPQKQHNSQETQQLQQRQKSEQSNLVQNNQRTQNKQDSQRGQLEQFGPLTLEEYTKKYGEYKPPQQEPIFGPMTLQEYNQKYGQLQDNQDDYYDNRHSQYNQDRSGEPYNNQDYYDRQNSYNRRQDYGRQDNRQDYGRQDERQDYRRQDERQDYRRQDERQDQTDYQQRDPRFQRQTSEGRFQQSRRNYPNQDRYQRRDNSQDRDQDLRYQQRNMQRDYDQDSYHSRDRSQDRYYNRQYQRREDDQDSYYTRERSRERLQYQTRQRREEDQNRDQRRQTRDLGRNNRQDYERRDASPRSDYQRQDFRPNQTVTQDQRQYRNQSPYSGSESERPQNVRQTSYDGGVTRNYPQRQQTRQNRSPIDTEQDDNVRYNQTYQGRNFPQRQQTQSQRGNEQLQRNTLGRNYPNSMNRTQQNQGSRNPSQANTQQGFFQSYQNPNSRPPQNPRNQMKNPQNRGQMPNRNINPDSFTDIELLQYINKEFVRQQLSAEEIFEQFDANQDGILTCQEFCQACNYYQIKISNQLQLRAFDILDVNGNQSISLNEFAIKIPGARLNLQQRARKLDVGQQLQEEIYQVFKYFDTDGDGVISEKEIVEAFKAYGMAPNQQQVSDLIRKMDKNRNGKIEFDEFRLVMEDKIKTEILSDEDTMEDLRQKFIEADTMKQGYLTPSQLLQVLTDMKINITPADLQPLVQMADVNQDGKIDVDEFIMILNGSNPQAVYDSHTMSIVINIRKSRRISPIDFIKVAGDMPSHFTPSFILEQHKIGKILPSQGFIPTLQSGGVNFQDVKYIDLQGQGNSFLKPSPMAVGGFITLNQANGVSIPDIKSSLRSRIIGRILRITFFDQVRSEYVGNSYAIDANWRDDIEDKWTFERQADKDYHILAFRVGANQDISRLFLVFEYNILVQVENDSVEFSSGYSMIQVEELMKQNKHAIGIEGGSPQNTVKINPQDIRTYRSGFRHLLKMTGLLNIRPELKFTVQNLNKINQYDKTQLECLPTNCVVQKKAIQICRIYREYGAKYLVQQSNDNCFLPYITDTFLTQFPKIMNCPDIWMRLIDFWSSPEMIQQMGNNRTEENYQTHLQTLINRLYCVLKTTEFQFSKQKETRYARGQKHGNKDLESERQQLVMKALRNTPESRLDEYDYQPFDIFELTPGSLLNVEQIFKTKMMQVYSHDVHKPQQMNQTGTNFRNMSINQASSTTPQRFQSNQPTISIVQDPAEQQGAQEVQNPEPQRTVISETF